MTVLLHKGIIRLSLPCVTLSYLLIILVCPEDC